MKVRLEVELEKVVSDISPKQLLRNIHHHVDNVVRAVLEGSCESWESYELEVGIETDDEGKDSDNIETELETPPEREPGPRRQVGGTSKTPQ